MATKNDDIEQVAVDELRRKYDELCHNNDQLRLKAVAFITGELALATFLFNKGIPLPIIIYGVVFFIFGIGCVTASFIMLLTLLKSASWHLPVNRNYIREIDGAEYPDKASFLEYIKDCYITVLDKNTPKVSKANRRFDISLLLLVVGVIMLLIIKYGQGAVLWHNIIHT